MLPVNLIEEGEFPNVGTPLVRLTPEHINNLRRRGQELMRTIVGAFPDVEILAYATFLPETWDELVQQEVNDIEQAFAPSVQIDFWDGLTSV